MLNVTDTFIEFLAAELIDVVQVYWWRQSAVDEHAGLLKQDALNVQFLGFYEQGSLEYCLTSLDLLGSDERVVLGQLLQLRDVLQQREMAPEYDYTLTISPVPTGRQISWDPKRIKFINVRTPKGATYSHYNCTFPLLYARF